MKKNTNKKSQTTRFFFNFSHIESLGVNVRSYKHGVFRNPSLWRHETCWQTNKSVAMHARANSAIVQILVHRVMLAARSRYRALDGSRWTLNVMPVLFQCLLCVMTSLGVSLMTRSDVYALANSTVHKCREFSQTSKYLTQTTKIDSKNKMVKTEIRA